VAQVASYHMFLAGAFSSNPDQPHQVDAAGLKSLSEAAIRAGFQVVRCPDAPPVPPRTAHFAMLCAVCDTLRAV
jgi:hypothetical protein